MFTIYESPKKSPKRSPNRSPKKASPKRSPKNASPKRSPKKKRVVLSRIDKGFYDHTSEKQRNETLARLRGPHQILRIKPLRNARRKFTKKKSYQKHTRASLYRLMNTQKKKRNNMINRKRKSMLKKANIAKWGPAWAKGPKKSKRRRKRRKRRTSKR
jgi:hypothetical protein